MTSRGSVEPIPEADEAAEPLSTRTPPLSIAYDAEPKTPPISSEANVAARVQFSPPSELAVEVTTSSLSDLSSPKPERTPLDWAIPKSVPRLPNNKDACPTLLMERFQKKILGIMLDLVRGYLLFLKIPEKETLNDLKRLRTFKFFDKEEFLKARGEHADYEPYEKALMPFLKGFVK